MCQFFFLAGFYIQNRAVIDTRLLHTRLYPGEKSKREKKREMWRKQQVLIFYRHLLLLPSLVAPSSFSPDAALSIHPLFINLLFVSWLD